MQWTEPAGTLLVVRESAGRIGHRSVLRYSAGGGVQYYLELDPKIDDVYFESSAFPKASEQFEAIAKRLGLPSHFELFSYAAQNDLCPPEHQETEIPWHEPQVGINWLEAVSNAIRSNPTSVPNADRLLIDFAECKDVLQRAKSEGSKWHFAMDI